MSGCDAVDGSSTGTRVPRIWASVRERPEMASRAIMRGQSRAGENLLATAMARCSSVSEAIFYASNVRRHEQARKPKSGGRQIRPVARLVLLIITERQNPTDNRAFKSVSSLFC